MQEYWIETRYFAASIGGLTPEKHALFYKWCQEETEKFNENFCRKEQPAFILHDYTLQWETLQPNADSEKMTALLEEVKHHEELLANEDYFCTLLKIFPEDAIKDDRKAFRSSSIALKKKRYDEVLNDESALKDHHKQEWNLLTTFAKLAEIALDNEETQDEQTSTDDTAEQEDISDILDKLNGRWVSQDDFLNFDINANRNTFTNKSFRRSRETLNLKLSKKNPTIGMDKDGRFFQRTGNRWNYDYKYFLLQEYDKTLTSQVHTTEQ